MSTDLVNVDLSQLPSVSMGDDAVYNDLAKAVEFLGRVQLVSKGKLVDKGLVRPGHYAIPESAEEANDLGDAIDIIPFARRPKALDMSDKDALVASYDPNSDEFKRIAAKSAEKESSCMYGVEFLVFERSTGRFLEFFCGTKSTRSEAKKLYPFMALSAADIEARKLTDVDPHGPLPLTLKSRYVEKGAYSWFVPVVVKCSTPFNNLPAADKIVAEITKFLNPKTDGVEKVQEPAAGKKRAR
jgi:hypothetical protein